MAFNKSTLDSKALSDKGVGDGLQRGNSESDSDSTVKIAREAIEIGKILGLEVIVHKDNAVKRITETLKTNRPSR